MKHKKIVKNMQQRMNDFNRIGSKRGFHAPGSQNRKKVSRAKSAK